MTQILLAEDDRISRIMLQAVLQKWGYRVVSVSDGQQALEKLLDPEGPSLAILDWMMPGLTGVEVCQRIRSEVGIRPIHLMLLTSKAKGTETAESLDAGADDHLSKPYNLAELQARIKLGLRRLGGQSLGGPTSDSSGGGPSANVEEFCANGCIKKLLPLNRIALGVVMEHPELLTEPAIRPGTCDMDIEVQTLLLHSRVLLQGWVECAWEGGHAMLETSSESLGQILVNLLVFFRATASVGPCQVAMAGRQDDSTAVLELESSQPEISQVALDRLCTIPSEMGVGGSQGFGPYFAKLAAEAVGGSLRMVSRPYGGVAVQIRIPMSR